jgi:antitoxin component YwqK of YwqJK toxin-antitoxin module
MRIIFRYLIILAAFILFGCKSTKIASEPNSRKTEMEFYKNGLLKNIGQIDSNYLSKAARIGSWSAFYENGKLKETGEYKTDTYVNCCIAGPCDIIYSYKFGEWNYYHENGQLRAKGIYKIDKKHIETTCEGGDEINSGFLNENWKFYDKKGIEIKLTEKEIKEIEKNGIVDEFDFMGK